MCRLQCEFDMIWYGVHLLAPSFNNLKKVYICIKSGYYSITYIAFSKLIKTCLLFMRSFLHCAFACASSGHWTFYRRSHIAYTQRVSLRCVKTCDTSNHQSYWRRSCTDHIQRAFLQCVWGCVSSDLELLCKNSYTSHTWKASLLNVFACASWGY